MTNQKSKSDIIKKRGKKPKSLLRKILIFIFVLGIIGIMSVAGAGFGIYRYYSKDLPQITTLNDYRPPTISVVYSDDNRKIGEFYRERRIVVPLDEMPEMLLHAFISAEDSRFFEHQGIDFYSIIRAFFKNIEAGTIVQGGSTITQQVTKSFLLTPERSYTRKIKEAILAYRIEKRFKKSEILYLYLNQIYLGHGAYGVAAASENYFGKSVSDLNLAECAILAGLPQAPSRYSPFKYRDRANERQVYVLNRMVAEGYISNIQATEAINTKLDIKPRRNWYIEKAPHFTEHVRRYVEEKYGPNRLYEDGLRIYTTVDIEMQKIARAEIKKGLLNLDKRQGYRGVIRHLSHNEIQPFLDNYSGDIAEKTILEAVVIQVDDENAETRVRFGSEEGVLPLSDMRWARKPNPEVVYGKVRINHPSEVLKVGDVIMVSLTGKNIETGFWGVSLEQNPIAQAALMCMEAETGHIKAMIGGRDFKDSQFNRAVQSRRQPGSAFKPIIYAAAIDKGYTPATVVIDSPLIFEDEERDFKWKPKNYGNRFYGPTLVRKALAKSRNVVTVKMLQDIGIDNAIAYAKKLGIDSHMNRDLSISLGSSGMSLLELIKAYSVFDNLGYLITPTFITKIVDRDGNIIEENFPYKEKVIESETAYIMNSMLESVVTEGTGHRIRALGRPAAGKTGTTNNLYDAWFMGYTPKYVTGTWVGFDQERSLGELETGSRAASPIWLGFMKRILEGKPVEIFKVPEGIVFAEIDLDTGLLPIPESKNVRLECFKDGTVPTEHTPKPDVLNQQVDLYKSDF